MKKWIPVFALLIPAFLLVRAQEHSGTGYNCQEEEDTAQKEQCLHRAVSSNEVKKDSSLYRKLESELLTIYRRQRNSQEQARQIERVKTWLANSRNPDLLYWFFLMNADYNLFIKNEDLAIEYYEKCKELIPYISKDVNRCSVHNNLGVHYYRMGRLKEAMENYTISLECRDLYKDTLGMARLHKNIGNLYLRGYTEDGINDNQKGKEHWDKALELYEAMNDTTGGIIDLYFNYAYSSYLPNIRDRVHLLEKGIHIAENNGNTDFLIDAYELRGRLFASLQDYREAYESLQKRAIYQQDVIHGLQNIISEKGSMPAAEEATNTERLSAGAGGTNRFFYFIGMVVIIVLVAVVRVVLKKKKGGDTAEKFSGQT